MLWVPIFSCLASTLNTCFTRNNTIYQLVVGENEDEDGTINIRNTRENQVEGEMKVDDLFVEFVKSYALIETTNQFSEKY